MDCRKDKNLIRCNCSYAPCSRKGICCECLQYHLNMRELPACCFPDEVEKTFDRSFERFAQLVKNGAV
ncbi:MAG: cytosolic protein [Chloroflexi bacterium]|nr:cytosolic protein [Chloroflexota bacterium]